MAICEGLDGEEIKELYTSIKVLTDKSVLKPRDIKPTSKHYKIEIQQRTKLVGELIRPKHWTNKPMLDWLKEKRLT
eukprot:7947256-Ditylum_brightwellii.AAC.1